MNWSNVNVVNHFAGVDYYCIVISVTSSYSYFHLILVLDLKALSPGPSMDLIAVGGTTFTSTYSVGSRNGGSVTSDMITTYYAPITKLLTSSCVKYS